MLTYQACVEYEAWKLARAVQCLKLPKPCCNSTMVMAWKESIALEDENYLLLSNFENFCLGAVSYFWDPLCHGASLNWVYRLDGEARISHSRAPDSWFQGHEFEPCMGRVLCPGTRYLTITCSSWPRYVNGYQLRLGR